MSASEHRSPERQLRTWHLLLVVLREEAREALEYGLMEAGALGTETSAETYSIYNATVYAPDQLLRIHAYFDALPDLPSIRETLLDSLRIYSLSDSALIDTKVFEVPAHDWLGEWKKSWQPVEIGTRFVVAPPWSEVERAPDRIVLRIEPGMAFGTGTHETTRLCLAALEKYFAGGSCLDVGTGTGILAIAAAKLFPDARVEACDTDAEAVEIARANARLNGVAAQINFRVGTVEETTASASLVCANLTADVILSLLPALKGATCERLLLSGILNTQVDMVRSRLSELGAAECEVVADGEWVALIA